MPLQYRTSGSFCQILLPFLPSTLPQSIGDHFQLLTTLLLREQIDKRLEK